MEKSGAIGSVGQFDVKLDEKLVLSVSIGAKKDGIEAGLQASVDVVAELQILAAAKGGAWPAAVSTLVALVEGGVAAADAAPKA